MASRLPAGCCIDDLKTAATHDERMEPPPSAWVIVVVRAWCDHGHLVVRLLMTRPGTNAKATQTVVGSVEEACEALRQQLRTVAEGSAG